MSRIHISLPVSDLDRSVAFYQTLFGQSPGKIRDDYANFRLDEPGLMLALVVRTGEARKTTNDLALHYGVELASGAELTSWRDRVRQAGLATRDEDDVVCCYARADKFWAQDPDGNEWEFWYRKADADTMHDPRDQKPACCS